MSDYLNGKELNYWETCTRTKIDGTTSEKRVPICLCLDLSGSMWQGKNGFRPVDKLITALKKFVDDIKSSANGRSAEIAIVAFVNKSVILQDFTLADQMTTAKVNKLCKSFLPNYEHLDNMYRCGDLEQGVIQSLLLLESRKDLYHKYGISYWQPMLVIMTDGVPTRGTGARAKRVGLNALAPMIQEIKERRDSRKLSVISVLCSSGVRENQAKELLQSLINEKDQVYTFDSNQPKSFDDFFLFLSMSVSAASKGKVINVSKFQEKLNADSESGKSVIEPNDLEEELDYSFSQATDVVETSEEDDEKIRRFLELDNW